MKEYNYCLKCGRKLKGKEARMLGYGKICYLTRNTKKSNPLFSGLKNNKKEK